MAQLALIPRTIQVEDVKPIISGQFVEKYQFEWNCPNCGGKVVAARAENTNPEEIAANALCFSCRRKQGEI